MNEFNELLKLAGLDEILIEGVASYRPTAKVLSDDEYKYLISLDPTYQGGDEFGKFSKWILSLGILLKKDLIQYAKWKEQQDLGRNFPQPQKKSKENDFTDFEDLPELLKKFSTIQKAPNITTFDSVAALREFIANNSDKAIEDDLARKRINLFKKCVEKGGKIVFKDSKWIVAETPTLESNVVFGSDTNWCTTAPNGYMYHNYLKQHGGTYFVNLYLLTGALYQIHFESQQIMNEKDAPVSFVDLVSTDPKLKDFYKKYLEESDNRSCKKYLADILTEDERVELKEKEYNKLLSEYEWKPFGNILYREVTELSELSDEESKEHYSYEVSNYQPMFIFLTKDKQFILYTGADENFNANNEYSGCLYSKTFGYDYENNCTLNSLVMQLNNNGIHELINIYLKYGRMNMLFELYKTLSSSLTKEQIEDIKKQEADYLNEYYLEFSSYNRGEYIATIYYDDIPYDSRSRDSVSQEFFVNMLSGNAWESFESWDPYIDVNSILNYNSPSEFNRLDLPMTFEQLFKAYDDGELEKYFDEEYAEKVKELFDDYGNSGVSFLSAYSDCVISGTETEAIDDAVNVLKSAFDVKEMKEETFEASFTYEDLFSYLTRYEWYDLDFVLDDFLKRYLEQKINGEKLSLEEPRYGWDGFDEDTWETYNSVFVEDMKKLIDEGLLDHLKSYSSDDEEFDFDEISNNDWD